MKCTSHIKVHKTGADNCPQTSVVSSALPAHRRLNRDAIKKQNSSLFMNCIRNVLAAVVLGPAMIGSCTAPGTSEPHIDHPFAALSSHDIPISPPISGRSTSLQDLALSLPVWEITANGAREALARGSLETEVQATSWTAFGDGAQPTVRLELLNAGVSFPGPYRLIVGPICSHAPGAPSYTFTYTLELHPDHWQRLEYDRKIQNVSPWKR